MEAVDMIPFSPKIVRFGINTPLRQAHFFAQCAHESQGFTKVEENLNYSAKRLATLFPKKFHHDTPPGLRPHDIAGDPVRVGNFLYGGRYGNGPDEGYLYRGRGYMMITFKDNYKKFDKFIEGVDLVANPDLVATNYPLESAAWFWMNKNLNRHADLGPTYDAVKRVRKTINGGYIGLEDVWDIFQKLYPIIMNRPQ